MSRSTSKTLVHVRAAHDFIGAPALLVSGCDLRALPAYARVAVPGGFSVPLEWLDAVEERAAGRPRCAACDAGEPCAAWDWDALARRCVSPRVATDTAPRAEAPPCDPDAQAVARALEILDMTEGEAASEANIKSAYRLAALRLHPDRGGDAAMMAAATAARDTLLRRLVR